MKFILLEKPRLSNVLLIPLLAGSLVLAGCSSDDDDDGSAGDNGTLVDVASNGGTDANNTDGTDISNANSVILTTVASDFSSSALEIFSLSEPREGSTGLSPGVSDTIVRSFEDQYFVIRRFMSDSIAAYNSSDPSTIIFESTTNDDDDPASSNPQDLVFVNSEKAYLLRLGSPTVLVVNPSATSVDDFRLGEIDLSAYDPDGIPEAASGIVVGDQLFIFMQRLENFVPVREGAVAVIDINTDTEIDTGTNDEFMGIILPAFNPSDISFDAASNTIFAQAFGDFGAFDGSRPPALTGGIITVDPEDFSTTQLVDDTDETGRITAVEIIDADTAYMITETAFLSSSLVRFNPVTGSIEATGVAGFSGVDIRDIARGPAGNLWVALGGLENPMVVVLDPDDGSVVGSEINTSLIPTGINFVE